MTEPPEELQSIADRLDSMAEQGDEPTILKPLETLARAAQDVGRAFSGSWWGYHANVYYDGLMPPPPGARFSQEWGLGDHWPIQETRGDWHEYESERVKSAVQELARNPDLKAARKFNKEAACDFDMLKMDAISIIEMEIAIAPDPFLSRLRDEIENLSILTPSEVIERLQPKGQIMTRDSVVLGQGMRVPPHISILSEVLAIQNTLGATKNLAKCA